MRVALAWRSKVESGAACNVDTVVRRLDDCFASLAQERLERHSFDGTGFGFASIHLDTEGFEAPVFESSEKGWAFATEYPVNATRVAGVAPRGRSLLAVAEILQNDHAKALEVLCPPFALFAHLRSSAQVVVQNDGLGQGQLFVYEDDRVWAISNRIGAFRALGLRLEPEPLDWAVRFTLGWFPLDMSGYRRVRHVAPGTRFAITTSGVEPSQTDVLSSWIHRERQSSEVCQEQAAASIEKYLEDLQLIASCPTVGLSGGWDSRAVAAVMRTQGSSFKLRVRGHPERFDVRISAELGRIADLPVRMKTQGGYPPDTAEACRACIQRAIQWQGGHMATLKHKTFLAKRPQLGRGVVNVMGQHSGIGKADFAAQIGADKLDPEEYEDELIRLLMKGMPSMLASNWVDEVEQVIRQAYRAADRFDLKGLHRLHFFFLNEYTRRWGSATVNAQGGAVATPFLNPDFIRAAYAFDPERLPEKPFHRHITGRYAPDWAQVVYTDQARLEDMTNWPDPIVPSAVGGSAEGVPDWRRGRKYGKYHQGRFWRQVGWPLVDDALTRDGWWNTLFAPGADKRQWCKSKGAADAIVISHLLEGALVPEVVTH